jgi:hypothetical protein
MCSGALGHEARELGGDDLDLFADQEHDGTSHHRGRSPDGAKSASCVAGRCVAAIRAASGAGMSGQPSSWQRSRTM